MVLAAPGCGVVHLASFAPHDVPSHWRSALQRLPPGLVACSPRRLEFRWLGGQRISPSHHVSRAADVDTSEGAIPRPEYAKLSKLDKLLQPLQLAASIWLLLLLPAGLLATPLRVCGGSVLGLLPFEYFAFFCAGTLPRVYRFGKFAKKKAASKEGGARVRDFLLFQLALFASHWIAVYQLLSGGGWRFLQIPAVSAFLSMARLSAILLTATSAWTLGKAYDRVISPEQLVTTGPYRLVRHPIYTSYLLLFGAGLLSLGSPLACAVLVAAAVSFYSRRMRVEEVILQERFGKSWEDYAARTRRRLVPFLL